MKKMFSREAKTDIAKVAGKAVLERDENVKTTAMLEKFAKISVPEDGNCLFWAATLAYLSPVKNNDEFFQNRFQRLFGSKNSAKLKHVQKLLKSFNACLNNTIICSDETLKRLVTLGFRNRVVDEMAILQTAFEDYITVNDFLHSQNRDYFVSGTFKDSFLEEFKGEINHRIDIINLKPNVFNWDAMNAIEDEFTKVADRDKFNDKVKSFKFRTYLKCMRSPNACGGDIEIKAMSQLLRCKIFVFCNGRQYLFKCDYSNDRMQLFCDHGVRYQFGLVRAQKLMELIKCNKQHQAKIYLKFGIDDIDYKDSSKSTILHFAVQCGNEDVIQELLDQGASTDVKNILDQSPFDSLTHLGRNDIICSLRRQNQVGTFSHSNYIEQLSINKQLGSKSTNGETKQGICNPICKFLPKHQTAVDNDFDMVNARLEEFVEYFVKEFETKLHAYHMFLEGEISKAGKFSETFSGKIGQGFGGTVGGLIGFFLGSAAAGSKVGIAVGKEIGEGLGNKLGNDQHASKTINLLDLIDYSQKEKGDFRKILVETGLDIFQSFEMQFMRVTTDQGPKDAMHKLAKDGTNRAINYMKSSKCTSVSSISEAVILGESKIESVLNIPIPTSCIKSPGFKITYGYRSDTAEWITSSMYKKTGLVVIENETFPGYYKKDDRASMTSKYEYHAYASVLSFLDFKRLSSRTNKYGYRRLLKNERWDSLKEKYVSENTTENRRWQFTDYQYRVGPKISEAKSRSILDDLNSKDENLGELRIKEVLVEVKNDIIQEINVLKELSQKDHNNDYWVLVNTERNLESLKIEEYFETFKHNFQEAKQERQEIAASIQKAREENKELLQQIFLKINEVHDELLNIKQEPVSFRVKAPLMSFADGEEDLENLQEPMKYSDQGEKAVVLHAPSVNDLGEASSTEPARMHDYGNVTGACDDTHVTSVKSFNDLGKDSSFGNLVNDNGEGKKKAEYSVKDRVKTPLVMQFTGREQELKILHEAMQHSEIGVVVTQTASICKLGGVGKTELARKYVYDHSQDYDGNVIWINAENHESLVQSFLDLARDRRFRIRRKRRDGRERKIHFIVRDIYLQLSKTKSIFVFDNAEKLDDLKSFLPLHLLSPSSNKPYILITSRNAKWGGGIDTVKLEELRLEDAVEFVKRGLGISDEDSSQNEDISDLVEKLHHFPLAIQQAVAYINRQKLSEEFSVCDYVKQYETHSMGLVTFEVFGKLANDYEKTIYRTFKNIIDKLGSERQDGQLALKLLYFMGYFAPENINREIFLCFSDDNEKQLKSAVRLLVKYSLINGEQRYSVLSIHRLLQKVVRLELKQQGREEQILKDLLKLTEANLDMVLDHAVSVWDHASEYEELVKEFRHLPKEIIYELDKGLKHEQAYTFGCEASMLLKRILGPNDPDTLLTMNNLALVLYHRANFAEALKMFQEVLEKRREAMMQDDFDALIIMNYIASSFRKEGNYDKALDAYREVLDKRKEINGLDHPETLITMKGIARVLVRQEKFEEALEIFKEVLGKQKNILGESDPDILITMDDIASVVVTIGKYEEALNIYRELLDKRNKITNPNYADILELMNAIAVVLEHLERHEEALQVYKELLQGREKYLGRDHFDTLETIKRIAAALGRHEKYSEALEVYREVLEMQKAYWGIDFPDNVETVKDMAIVLLKLGNYEEVSNIFERLLKELELITRPQSVDLLETMRELSTSVFSCLISKQSIPKI